MILKKPRLNMPPPTHCSGDGTIKVFREIFGNRYLKLGTGRVVRTADL